MSINNRVHSIVYIKLLFKAIGTDNAKKLSDEVIRITRHGISRSH